MSSKPERSLEQLRKIRNKELMRRVRSGESTNSFDSFASWFPPRPIIKKDPQAIGVLYGKASESSSEVVADLVAHKKSDDNDEQKTIPLTRIK